MKRRRDVSETFHNPTTLPVSEDQRPTAAACDPLACLELETDEEESGDAGDMVTADAYDKGSGTLTVAIQAGETGDQAITRYALAPEVGSAVTCLNFTEHNPALKTDLNHVAAELQRHCEAVSGGDLSRVEHMLAAQLHSLDAIFNTLAHRAKLNMGTHLDATECYLKLALRAQSQCRATAETLAAVKNPPVVFAKQANIAHGHQQVNNGVPVAHAGQNQNLPNELLEHVDGNWLDTGAASTSGRSNQTMATVAVIRGTKNQSR